MRLTFLLLVTTTTTTTTSFCRAFVVPRQGQRRLGLLLLHNSRNPFMLVDNGNYDRDADDEHQQQQQQHWRYSSRNEPWSWNEAAASEFVNDGHHHHHHHYGSFQSNNRIRVPDKPASAYMTIHDEDDNDSFVDDFDDIIDDDEDDSVFGDVSSPAVNIFPQATTNDIDSFMSTQGHPPGPPPFGMFLQEGHKSSFPESVINPKSTLPPPPPGLIPDWVTEKASLSASSSSSSSYYDNVAHDNDWPALSSPRADRVPGPPPYGMFLKEKQRRQQQQEEEAVVDLFKDWTPPPPPQEAAEHYPGESSLPLSPPPLHSSGPPAFGLFQQDEMEWANTFEDFDVFNHQNHHHDVEDDLPPLLHQPQQQHHQQQQQHQQQRQSMSIPTHPHESSFGIWEDALSLDPASELSFQHESSAEDTVATLRGPPPEGLYMQDVMELPTSHVHNGLSP